jgi:hypothetical protein
LSKTSTSSQPLNNNNKNIQKQTTFIEKKKTVLKKANTVCQTYVSPSSTAQTFTDYTSQNSFDDEDDDFDEPTYLSLPAKNSNLQTNKPLTNESNKKINDSSNVSKQKQKKNTHTHTRLFRGYLGYILICFYYYNFECLFFLHDFLF